MLNLEKVHHSFREKLKKLSKEDLLEIIEKQNPHRIKGVNRIEWVFRNKLGHLNWKDGDPVLERDMTVEELALLVDVPFEYSDELAKLGLDEGKQREIHVASDPVLWAEKFLKVKLRVYQVIILRDPNTFKVLRAGRRIGKSFTMAVSLLWYSYVTNNGRSLVVTPMKAQASLIYDECLRLAKQGQIVESSIIRHVTSPNPTIEFSNGSTIRFFTSGMKSAGKADVTRGQEAHLIILDELDYMGEDDMDALLAMLQKTDENQPEKRLMAASTPSGRRAKLWEWDMSPRFSSFWYPSYVNPYWNIEQEEYFRDMYTETGYRHEIEADWGEDADGVYPRKYVDKCFYSGDNAWSYKLPVDGKYRKENSSIIFGVDWDKFGAGTSIVILEAFDTTHADKDLAGRLKLLYREETPREEYTLTNSVDRIIYLNNIYKPTYIYVDRGFGETQIELLKKHGMAYPNTGLEKSVVGVSFAQTIEVPDPYSGKKDKKPIKPFMVDTLRQYLERQSIMFSEQDEELYLQLISYIVSATTETGRPKFEMSGSVADHCHDALILSTLAVRENFDDMMRFKSTNYVRAVNAAILNPLIALGSSSKEVKVTERSPDSPDTPIVLNRSNTIRKSHRKSRIKRRSF